MTKGEQTRQQIIEQAAPVFNQQGYAGTSIDDLLRATGLQKGGLYRHFNGKQELAAEVFRYAIKQAFAFRLDHADTASNPMARLRAMVDGFVERPSPVAGGCPLLNTAIDADDTNPELRLLALRALATWKAWIGGHVEEGIAAGLIVAGTEPARVADQIISTLEGALLISRLERNRNALRHAGDVLHCVLDAIAVA